MTTAGAHPQDPARTPDAAAAPGAAPPAAVLGPNQYGKAETRVVRVTRDGPTHHIRDLNVSVALSGAMAAVHHTGDNANVLTTDATKNTVYAFAREYGVASPEEFGLRLARHFVTSQGAIHRARIRIEEYTWDRIPLPVGDGGRDSGRDGDGTAPAPHSFVRSGRETRTAQITFDGARCEVIGGLRDLVVMNSTDSEFWGYTKDRYTTLPETRDRILATRVTGAWRFGWEGGSEGGGDEGAPDWDASYAAARGHLLEAFADTYSYSLQQTLYSMGARIVERCDGIDEVRFSLPNQHHFLVDLEPFGLDNEGEVYFAADRPYGLIEATVLRPGHEARIPEGLTAP